MPLLSFHTASSLPLDFVDLLQSLYNAMWNGLLTLAAFFVSTSFLQQNGVQSVAGQYLLGLGESESYITKECKLTVAERHRGHHRVRRLASCTNKTLTWLRPVVETNLMARSTHFYFV